MLFSKFNLTTWTPLIPKPIYISGHLTLAENGWRNEKDKKIGEELDKNGDAEGGLGGAIPTTDLKVYN